MKEILANLILLTLITLVGCSKKESSIPPDHNSEALNANEEFFRYPDEVSLYNPNQPNSANIKKCAFADEIKESCLVSESPLIGIGKEQVSVQDILNKTLSSRVSYVETFRNVLQRMPEDTLQLFGSINAIVISERIVPSFYNYSSGAIYLSSSYFWKTPEEKALIKSRDYRETFGNSLQFSEESDFIKNGRSLFSGINKKYRSDEEIAPNLARLLFHELAHANDFYPRSFYRSSELDSSKTYYQITDTRWDNKKVISQGLESDLKSNLLLRVGSILYRGDETTQEELEIKPRVIVDEFINDVAADMYAYSTPREDLAKLLEHSMFYYHFGYSAYTIFIKYPYANFKIPEKFEYPIAGGVKNKIADAKVKVRAGDALEKILNADYSKKVIQTLDLISPVEIPEDTSWDEVQKIQ